MTERIQKILARAGLASRREAERMLLEGRVRVNGRVVTALGTRADPERDSVRLDGRLLKKLEPRRITIAMHKPRSVVSTRSDPEGRATVLNLVRGVPGRLYPIGRLDYDAEGLLLVTNDGDLAYRLLRPGGAERVYHVKVKGQPDPAQIERLRAGIFLDGKRTLPAHIRTLRRAPAARGGGRAGRRNALRAGQNRWLEVAMHEGRRNQLVRMFRAIGNPVLRLRRIRIGPVGLGALPPGRFRYLEPDELEALHALSGGTRTERGRSTGS